METEEINILFNEFLQSIDLEKSKTIWEINSNKFRVFWDNYVLDESIQKLEEQKIDEIIRILDKKGKGNTKESEAVANVMISQNIWRKMFEEIKQDRTIKDLLNQIFTEKGEGIIQPINELYEYNKDKKNSLTGKSANAINAMNFAFNPSNYLSMVSLNDRKKIIDFFEIPDGPDFKEDPIGKQVFLSNKVIIEWFRDRFEKNVSPRIICNFLYTSLKNHWKEIPDYQSIMLPLLKFSGDTKEHSIRDAINYISNYFELSELEKRERLPSGSDKIINNRVRWAKKYLEEALLIESSKRGFFKVTPRGINILKEDPPEINIKFLTNFEEFRKFRSLKKEDKILSDEDEEVKTPNELIEEGYQKIKNDLSQEILRRLKGNSFEFLEEVGKLLLEKMGYGEGKHVGGPGDGGIDGVIYQDKLGLSKILLQTKRYIETNVVGPNDIKNFIATLDINKSSQGVFITTSTFNKGALEVVKNTSKTIILIDGERLSELMIEFNLGVSIGNKIYEIKEIDTDFFEE